MRPTCITRKYTTLNREELITLLHRYRTNQCTPEEAARLIGHIKSGRDQQLVETLLGQVYADGPVSDVHLGPSLDRVFRKVQEAKENAAPPRAGIRKIAWTWAAAAAVVVGVSLAIWQWADPYGVKPETAQLELTDIAPGGNRATLKLADGRTIDLSEVQQGIIVGDGIRYLDGTQVLENGKLKMENETLTFNSIATPKGGTYQVTLPDDTKVWLNAASTLTYPQQFGPHERRVILSGEAYFDVSPNKHKPFRVESRGQEIEVVGTAFNVSAYPDEEEAKTTLVEGAVRLAANRENVTLKPGQQGTLTTGTIRVEAVDVAPYVGWKDNEFVFDGIALPDAMKQLSRWYDMEVVYEGDIPVLPFYGSFSRLLPLSETLAILKEANVGFTMQKAGSVNRLVIHP